MAVTARIPLSGQPNNVSITKDGRKVYVAIREAPGALDVIDTVALKNVKTVPTKGGIHNVYVTPDSKWAVAGSIPDRTISIVDVATDTLARTIPMSAGIRPMAFITNPDGSTKTIVVQLSDFHGFATVDFATGKETARVEHPAFEGEHPHRDGLQGAPAHGLAVSPDGTRLWSTSKVLQLCLRAQPAGFEGGGPRVRRPASRVADLHARWPLRLRGGGRRQRGLRRRCRDDEGSGEDSGGAGAEAQRDGDLAGGR